VPADDGRQGSNVEGWKRAFREFSSDRSIGDYCRDIWHVEPVPIRL
jgi:hypothetical protein